MTEEFPSSTGDASKNSGQLNGLSIAGFVLSLCCCWPIALVLSIIGLIQVNNNPNQTGKGFALAGIITSAIGIFISLFLMLLPGFWEGFWSGFAESYY